MMLTTPLTIANQALLNAKTPQESKQVEALAAAAKAWAKEQNDFELAFEAACVYIEARCKTTKFIEPNITQFHGNRYVGGDNDVTSLADYGFDKKQWQRRKDELEAYQRFDEYQDDCIIKRILPTPFGLVGFFKNPHVSYNSGNNEWYTPAEYIQAARKVMGGIDLDPASSEIANKTVRATVYYTEQDDGLRYSWDGRVWMNPPYASELIGKFTDKLAQHYKAGEVTQAIVLVNNATETGWFQSILECASAVCFVKGRVKFIDMDGNPSGAPLQGQAILYLGDQPYRFDECFKQFGIVLYGRGTGSNQE